MDTSLAGPPLICRGNAPAKKVKEAYKTPLKLLCENDVIPPGQGSVHFGAWAVPAHFLVEAGICR